MSSNLNPDAATRNTQQHFSADDTDEEKHKTLDNSPSTFHSQNSTSQLQLLNGIIAGSRDLIGAVDRDFRFIAFNNAYSQGFEKVYGKKIALGMSVEDVLAHLPQEQAKFTNLMARALQGEEFSVIEEFGDDTRERKYYEVTLYPIKDENNQIIGASNIARDITERKLAEVKLRTSEANLAKTQQISHIGSWEFDIARKNTFWSEELYRIHGLDPSLDDPNPEQMGVKIHPDDLGIYRSAIQANIEAGCPFEADLRIIWAAGEVRYVEIRGEPVFDDSGQLVKFIGTTLDITERKKLELALEAANQELEQRVAKRTAQLQQANEELARTNSILQAVIQGTDDVIFVKDVQGRYVIANEAAAAWLGTTVEAMLGKDDRVLFPAEVASHIMEIDQRLIDTGEAITYEEDIPQQGVMRSLLSTKYPWCDDKGNILGVIGISRDITNSQQAESVIKASESKLRGFFDANIIGTLFGDIHGNISDANDEFLRIVGYTREDLRAGRLRWIDITPPEFLPLDEQAIAQAQEEGACTPYEKEYIRKDGSRVPVLVGYSLHGERREESVAFILDLTKRKQAESAMQDALHQAQAAREEAEKANSIKDEFLAVLSHELRTPLNPILGWTKLLKSGMLKSSQVAEALNIIERNAKLQIDLIEDLLDVSRILRGKLTLNVSAVNLESTISAAIETVRLAAENKGIQIQTQLSANVRLVSGDAARLQQILWNLLSNAVKFTPDDGRVEVRLETMGKYAHISVSDTGKGISPEFLPHIFEYFRQEDSSTTRKFGGLGLGLAIVRQLVELHGGTVEAESQGIGLGATFTVRLPIMSNQPAILMDKDSQDVSLDLTGIKALVVDDEADSRDLVSFVLELYGAEVTAVPSALAALQVLVNSKPDILVSDIGMPQMDGYELLRQIRTWGSDDGGKIPAIALTAYAGEFDQQQALAAGFQMHVPKPVEPDTLATTVARLVELRSAES